MDSFSLRITAADDDEIDAAAIERFALDLRAELADLHLSSIERVSAGPAPEGARALELLAVFEFIITMGKAGESINTILETIRTVGERYTALRKRFKVTVADVEVDLATANDEQLRKVVAAIAPTSGSPLSGVRKALIIANKEFDDPALTQLRAPAYDADALARVLGNSGIGGFDVELLADADERTVRLRIAAFFADRSRDDVLLVHFSGHGVKDARGRLYLTARDTKLSMLSATGIPASFVNDQMAETQSNRVVLILDCCYSGAFARGTAVRADDSVHIADEFGAGNGRIVLTASSATEYAFEGTELTRSDGQPSAFTSALVGGLETGAADLDNDGEISIDELYDYTYRTVRASTPGQAPMKWTFGVEGSLVIARSVRPAILPRTVLDDIASDRIVLRLEAVTALAQIARAGKPGLRAAAEDALVALRDHDDSSRVRAAAATILGPSPGAATPAAPALPTPPPMSSTRPAPPAQSRPATAPSGATQAAPQPAAPTKAAASVAAAASSSAPPAAPKPAASTGTVPGSRTPASGRANVPVSGAPPAPASGPPNSGPPATGRAAASAPQQAPANPAQAVPPPQGAPATAAQATPTSPGPPATAPAPAAQRPRSGFVSLSAPVAAHLPPPVLGSGTTAVPGRDVDPVAIAARATKRPSASIFAMLVGVVAIVAGCLFIHGFAHCSQSTATILSLPPMIAAALMLVTRQQRYAATMAGALSWQWILPLALENNEVKSSLGDLHRTALIGNLLALCALGAIVWILMYIIVRGDSASRPLWTVDGNALPRVGAVIVVSPLAIVVSIMIAHGVIQGIGATVETAAGWVYYIGLLSGLMLAAFVVTAPRSMITRYFAYGWLVAGVELAIYGSDHDATGSSWALWLLLVLLVAVTTAVLWPRTSLASKRP